MGGKDILSHYMMIRRPPSLLQGARGKVFRGGKIIYQGIKPDIGDIIRIKGEFYTPGKPLLGSGDAEVPKGLGPEKAKHFVPPGLRQYVMWILFNVLLQPLCIPGHQKEVVLLFYLLNRPATVRAVPVPYLLFGPEPLVRGTVPSLIGPLHYLTLFVKPLKEFLDHGLVFPIGGSDKGIIGYIESPPEVSEVLHHYVGMVLGSPSPLGSRLFHLLAVLISPGEKKDLFTKESVKPRQYIGSHRCVGVSYMGKVINIVYGGSDIESLHPLSPFLLSLLVS